jgi:cytochrome P450
MSEPLTVGRYREVEAVLDDPSFVVPAAVTADTGIAWLRGSVSRFANGTDHAARRADVEKLLFGLDVPHLRAEASAHTDAVLDDAAGGRLDVMSALARRAPLTVLAQALSIRADPAALADAVAVIAPAYPPGTDAERERRADKGVEELVAQLGGRDATTVTQLTILVQACDATAGLIGNSVHAALRLPAPLPDTDKLLAETLRYSPAVRNTRRVASADSRIGNATIEQGGTVILDFEAANRDPELFADPHRFDPERTERYLTFGHGFRACPGTDHALALAAGVVEAVLARCEAATAEIEYEPSPNLRLPAALPVAVR